jgi:hypothetical protein
VEQPQARTLLRRQRFAVDGDGVVRGDVDGRAFEHLAVQGHAAFREHSLRVAAGRNARAGDHLGDPILHGLLRQGLGRSHGAVFARAVRTVLA